MRFRLRTLLILLAVGPIVLAVGWRLWKSGGLPEAIDLAFITVAFLATMAGIHFTIKQNLGY